MALPRMRAASMAARAAGNPSMFSRDEPFHVGDRIDHLVRSPGGDDWMPAVVRVYTPRKAKEDPRWWAKIQVGDTIMHEGATGGAWSPATVTLYMPRDQPTPWRVEFDYEGSGAHGAVLLDDELLDNGMLKTVRGAPWRIAFDYEGGGSGAVLLDHGLNKVRACVELPRPPLLTVHFAVVCCSSTPGPHRELPGRRRNHARDWRLVVPRDRDCVRPKGPADAVARRVRLRRRWRGRSAAR